MGESMSVLGELYRETILKHYQNPQNFGVLSQATRQAGGMNPSCGDQVEVMVRLEGDTIADIRFQGQGCAISTASASLMTELVKGKRVAEALETIQEAFAPYYRTTILADETDPNKLHNLKADLDAYQLYAPKDIEELVRLYLDGADRSRLDPLLDACVTTYLEDLDEDAQIDFKSKAKAFLRTYNFLSSILPYTNAEWEKLSIFLEFLVPKLPAPREEDLSKGILEAIDLESYRVEKQAMLKLTLADENTEISPVPTSGGGHRPEPELDRLSNIIQSFNDLFGNIPWTDADRVRRLITEEIPARVAADTAYQNARKNSDKQNARIEHDKALDRVITALLNDDLELFKQFSDNESFRQWLTETVFKLTYNEPENERP